MTNTDHDATAVEEAAALALLTPEAVRKRSAQILAAGEAGELAHFTIDRDRLPATADYVAETIRQNYPGLDIPFHARWRHFTVDGVDRAAALLTEAGDDPMARCRAAIDLAVVSVLLDAGAGPDWRYRDAASGRSLARSEGLAIASLDMFAAGAFSSSPQEPLRADAAALAALTPQDIARHFQAGDGNPLVGLEGRAALLRRLGQTVAARGDVFGRDRPRVGGLADALFVRASGGALEAREILLALLDGLGPIWPGRIYLGGHNLGDTWRHRAARADDPSDGLVPFHKLSQWLAYSLIEPLETAGLRIADLDALTALAEYRNGGLLIDCGVLVPKHAEVTGQAHAPDSEVIVEWRALTVALIDRLAGPVRERLGKSEEELPLASLLEGGTWAAGRRIAAEKRHDGGPPISIVSDGSVF